MKGKRSFSEEALGWVRNMPIMETLDRLGVFWKQDREFQPEKDTHTVRLNVWLVGGVCG